MTRDLTPHLAARDARNARWLKMGGAGLVSAVIGLCVNCLAAFASTGLGVAIWEATGLDLGVAFGVRWSAALFSPFSWLVASALVFVPIARAMGVWGRPLSGRGRRRVWLGAAAVVLATPIGALSAARILLGPCSQEIVEPVTSPDGRWSAALVVRNCGAMMSEQRTVVLAPSSRGLNAKTDRLFGYGEAVRGVRWRGERLEVIWDYGEGDPPRREPRGPGVDYSPLSSERAGS